MRMDQEREPVTFESLTDKEAQALEILSEICTRSGLAISAEPKARHEPYLDVNVVGEDAAWSFGRHGSSLDALQYLTNLIVGRRVGPDVRLILDAADYRNRREESLRQLAMDIANEVKARQEEAELDPLPAHERRIIHNALLEIEGIR